MEISDSQLEIILKGKAPVLYRKIKFIESKLNSSVFPYSVLKDFTNHGLSHSKSIQENISNLLPKTELEIMNNLELFIIVSCSLLHDVGMGVTLNSNEDITTIRKSHAQRSREFIKKEREVLDLDEHIANIIGTVCEAHCHDSVEYIKDDEYSLKGCDHPRVRFLAVLLRIGDILDICHDRISDIMFRNRVFNDISEEHWQKHKNIANVVIDSAQWKIEIYANSNSFKESEVLRRMKDNIQQEFNLSRDYLVLNKLYFRLIDIKITERKDYIVKFNNPFILLKSFTNNDIVRFAGRLKEESQILSMLKKRKLILIIGESGVGKTSLVQAAILPSVRQNEYTEIIEFQLGKEEDLINQIIGSIKEKSKDQIIKDFFIKDLDFESLIEIIKLSTDNEKRNFLIVGDHLEQLFTLDKSVHTFILQLTQIFKSKLPFNFLFCIREDYLPQLFDFAGYIPDFYLQENTYRVFKLDKSNAIEVLNRASEIANIQLTPNFIKLLIDDLFVECDGTIFPPYLQIVGYKIYSTINIRKLDKVTDEILNDIYVKLGGISKIIIDYLAGILDAYKYEEKEFVGQILSTMITQHYTKKRVSYDFLLKHFTRIKNLDTILSKLIKDRIIKRSLSDYELAHDFLSYKIMDLIKEKKFLSSKVREAIYYIENNFQNNDLTVIDISNHIGVTSQHLVTLFKKELNKGINNYLNEIRVSKVKQYLSENRDSLKNISNITGFKDQNSFARTFKKFVGITPSEYRSKFNPLLPPVGVIH